jgi:TolB-like protein/class 3 adenylate cyclase
LTGERERVVRRLAAILAADVVGYSRLMGRDENGTLARLREHRKQRFEPILARHGGRLVKLMGDGALAEFPSAVDALSAAISFQQAMQEANEGQSANTAVVFRIGLHLGDLIVEADDLYGDGVNVAARLEAEAPPGGIVVSGDVHSAVVGRLNATFTALGDLSLKNIERPIRAHRVEWETAHWKALAAAAPALVHEKPMTLAPTAPALALPDKPSIAVLPFDNMSGDPEQEYFVDGLVEDVITALSRFKSLFVIARNSSFTYKGKSVDIKQVGRDLGVRYVLEGSVRKAGGKVRITGQLIDSQTGVHLWADRFDGGLEDVFDLQDRVTSTVVGAIEPRLQSAEIERAKRKPTESLDAYDYFLRGMSSFHSYTKDSLREARRHFQRATELDPDYASPLGMGAWCVAQFKANGWLEDENEIALGVKWARRAIAKGQDDSTALWSGGHSLAYLAGEVENGAAQIDRATTLNPNLAAAWRVSGWLRVYLGDAANAVEHLERAQRLSPLDPLSHFGNTGMAFAHFLAGRYGEAAVWASKAVQEQPNFATSLRIAAVANALAGRTSEAQEAVARLREIDPATRIGNLAKVAAPFRRQEDLARFTEGLRKAGLPE